ncbi:pyridoxamine 5'-phosphate oxidase family protein [Paenibacillus eucommiae]|uniref:Nitroimidazol reductase NimA-like FMN-containing flavoprotein (Pyridoxamine 5'-phosphate oxidase superfamily) n=1 Tax=Paenibacillus eucommiae TaxID=1355755 RepID=A0ABS4ILG1_9BACL|nr:pyridoxamine 5'-phosphate oxidase family protein [Paenibacillus eucommiae]MBP1988410.1 nitroimidazol reductase NimA-like FMN-containing flavoprotein (pyridoxamine 5'-phosphate oxidase superfamily) [Paenibacillus eucommiae]
MFPIRMQKRECTDLLKIQTFLLHAKTGYLGLSAKDTPYVVPLNFTWMNETIYFHGAAEGRKIDFIRDNPSACFTVSEEFGTITDTVPAHTDTAYMSVMIFGSVEFVTDLDEAVEAMQSMLNKYVPGYYDQPLSKTHVEKYKSSLGSRTLVFKLNQSFLSAKENERDEHAMFYAGKKIQ